MTSKNVDESSVHSLPSPAQRLKRVMAPRGAKTGNTGGTTVPLVGSTSWSHSWVRSWHPLLCAALAAVLLVACEEPSSGITGVTVVDTGCLVIPEKGDCPDRPLPARIVVADTEGEVVGRTASDQTGEFELALPPGDYRVQASNVDGAPLPSADEMSVTVRQGEFTPVKISFDSGIR